MSYANVIVLSDDLKTKMAIYDKLRMEPAYTVDIQTNSVNAAVIKFVKNKPNILIIDTDTKTVEQKLINLLIQKHSLYVICYGKRLLFNDPSMQFVMKPALPTPDAVNAATVVLMQKVKNIAARIPAFTAREMHNMVDARQRVVAVGSSTGGTDALPALLTALPREFPPVIIVQHMPSMFTKQLADRIDKISAVTVKEAQDGDFLMRGTAYIAPGGLHMRMVVRQQKLALECFLGDKINGVIPAADVLFDSVARISGANAVGVILTGMGQDGAKGLVEMHKKGATVIGQSKESCVVYGMPKAAKDLGAVDLELPLPEIPGKLVGLCE